jgi:hypothetical protein
VFRKPKVIRAGAISASVLLAGSLALVAPEAATASTCLPITGVEPPNPGGSGVTDLDGVAVVSPCLAWAVGGYEIGSQPVQTLIVRWNGRSWSQVASPDPNPATNFNDLLGVATVSARGAWAVGVSSSPGSELTLIAHWNGHHWRQVSSPSVPGERNELDAVTATSPINGWAVGSAGSRTLIEHWNGQHWAVAHGSGPGRSTPAGQLSGVTATSSRDAWAVGQQFDSKGFPATLILHWNGKTWKKVPSPNPAGASGTNVLFAVDATSASNAWAVGFSRTKSSTHTLIAHWNGKAWRAVPSPNPNGPAAGDTLHGVTVTGARNAWAVGSTMPGKFARTLIAAWNGKTWQRIPSPNPGTQTNDSLLSIDATSAHNTWAVGSFFNANQADQTIAIHCC